MKLFRQNLNLKLILSALFAVSIFAPGLEAQKSKTPIQETIPNPSWKLNTDDTYLTVAIVNSRPAIYGLTNPAQGWNWIPGHAEFPLLKQVIVGENLSPLNPDWKYQDAVVDDSDGRKLTLRFTSTAPKLELKSIWWARKGPGPVEQYMTIENQTGEDLTINGLDLVSADLSVLADNTVTLWRFNKTPRRGSPDANGYCRTDAGVFIDKLGPNVTIQSQFGKSGENWIDGELPFEMFDVGSKHGLYFGYDFGYGKFINSTSQNPLHLSSRFYLDDNEKIKVKKEVIFHIPGIFIGAYKGDTDDGSNRMKKWFWNYKIPPFLKNPDEPLIELCCEPSTDGEVDRLIALLKSNDFASWGVGIFKVDAWFAGDMRYCVPGTKPYARVDELADLIHSKNMRFSVWQGLFMPEKHLLARYDKWHFDYYRSDDVAIHPGDYWGYVDFWKKIDNLMAARPGFRWENCLGGGSLKAFKDCERMSFITTSDTPEPLDYKKALYPNSYMINPLQLKSDCYCRNTFDLRCAMMGSILMGVPETESNLRIMGTKPVGMATEEDMKKHFALYNTKQAPILRGADVYHILPMPDGKNWDGLEYFNTSIRKGSVFIFKPTETGGDSKVIKLKGLDRKTTYTLTFQDRPEQNVKKTGAYLMDKGLAVTMTGKYVSEIIWIE
jgi:hypothetical protein